jgi:hypothetical protein
MAQVEDFRQHGYLIMDNFIARDAAARIKADVSALYRKGGRQSSALGAAPAPGLPKGGGAGRQRPAG